MVGLIVVGVGILHAIQAKTFDPESTGMLTAGVGLILAQDAKKDTK